MGHYWHYCPLLKNYGKLAEKKDQRYLTSLHNAVLDKALNDFFIAQGKLYRVRQGVNAVNIVPPATNAVRPVAPMIANVGQPAVQNNAVQRLPRTTAEMQLGITIQPHTQPQHRCTVLDAGKCKLPWTFYRGPFRNAAQAATMDDKLLCLRGFNDFEVSSPSDNSITAGFNEKGDAVAAKYMLGEITTKNATGGTLKMQTSNIQFFIPPPPPPPPGVEQENKKRKVEDQTIRALANQVQGHKQKFANIENPLKQHTVEIAHVSTNVATLVVGTKIKEMKQQRTWHEVGRLDVVAQQGVCDPAHRGWRRIYCDEMYGCSQGQAVLRGIS